MKTAGVIAEFNPLHNGHIEHLSETKKITGCEKIICVMSGNFVQRGEPAICDSRRRTKMALLSGVDIVIEIPVPYVTAGADYFARGSVGLLAATGIVDVLSFGSEAGDLPAIKEAAGILAEEPPGYKENLRSALDKGLSFAAAKGAALEKCLVNIPEGLLTKPNNCLAIEYCKALRLSNPQIETITTHRKIGGVSAGKIRQTLNTEDLPMPEYAFNILKEARTNGEIAMLDNLSKIFFYLLYTKEFNLGEGLENRFKKYSGNFSKISDFLNAVKTKRYTYTRLQRTVLGMILGNGTEEMNFYEHRGGVQYIRVLGFRKESAGLLGELTKKATLPVITGKAAVNEILSGNNAAAKMLAKEFEANDIYRLAAGGDCNTRQAAGVIIV